MKELNYETKNVPYACASFAQFNFCGIITTDL